MIPRKVNLGEIRLKVMSGQHFDNAGQTNRHTDRRTDGRTDDMLHNTIRPKVPSVL